VTVVVFVYFPKKAEDVPEVESEALIGIAKAMVPLCIFLFGWTGLYFYSGIRWVNNGYVLMAFVFIVLTLWSLKRLSKLKLHPEPQPEGHS